MQDRVTRRGLLSVAGTSLFGVATGQVTGQQSSLSADFTYSPELPERDAPVTLDPSPSTAPTDVSITRYEWRIGSLILNMSYNAETFTHRFDSKGTYSVELIIEGSNGATDSTVQEIQVGNRPPTASMSVTPENPDPGETVVLSAQSTTDPEDNIDIYRWQVAGEQKTGERIEHTFSEEGEQTITLTVEDTKGATDSTTTELFVGDQLLPVSIPPLAVGVVGLSGAAGYYYLNQNNGSDDHGQDEDDTQPSHTVTDNGTQQRESHGSRDSNSPDETGGNAQYVKEPPEIDFSDVAGNETLIEELRDKVIDPLQNPEKYEEYGLGVETGFLLYGPPGTGKTYTTKALAGELERNWMPVMGSQLTERWVGAGTENIDRMFKEAIENEPVLLFLDEIDAIAPERGGADQHQDQTRQVNALLEWISKIYDEEYDVVIIGATNRRDQIDDAMLRSGRLTTEIEVPYPDEKARVEIFETHLEAPTRNLRLNEVADASEGLSAADMEAVATEAARIALERDEPVDTDDVLTAIDRIDTNKSRNR